MVRRTHLFLWWHGRIALQCVIVMAMNWMFVFFYDLCLIWSPCEGISYIFAFESEEPVDIVTSGGWGSKMLIVAVTNLFESFASGYAGSMTQESIVCESFETEFGPYFCVYHSVYTTLCIPLCVYHSVYSTLCMPQQLLRWNPRWSIPDRVWNISKWTPSTAEQRSRDPWRWSERQSVCC